MHHDFADFVLGKSNKLDVLGKVLEEWRTTAEKARSQSKEKIPFYQQVDRNGYGPYNEIVLAQNSDASDLPKGFLPQALGYTFNDKIFRWDRGGEHVSKLKAMLKKQRELLPGLLHHKNMMPEAFFAAEDGGPDCFLLLIGLDRSFGLTRLSTADRWIDAKVEKWELFKREGARLRAQIRAGGGSDLEAQLEGLAAKFAEESLYV